MTLKLILLCLELLLILIDIRALFCFFIFKKALDIAYAAEMYAIDNNKKCYPYMSKMKDFVIGIFDIRIWTWYNVFDCDQIVKQQLRNFYKEYKEVVKYYK